MARVLALIDGEHHPSVVAAAIRSRRDVVGAVLLGGTEKLHGDVDYGVPLVTGDSIVTAVHAAIDEFSPDEVHDLSDEPVLDARRRLRLAASALARGLPYVGADFRLEPPARPRVVTRPSIAVIGAGKRTGKTAVAGHLARLLAADGTPPVIVTMGRGGPAVPEVIDPNVADLSAAALVEIAGSGRHAASDHFEDAVTAGVTTVGTRRCGGGLAGAPADDTFAAGAVLADGIAMHSLVFEGSGTAIPPVHADATVFVVPASADPELVGGYLGAYRVLLSDLVVVTMVEQPLADSAVALEALVHELAVGEQPERNRSVVHTVFRPVPLAPVSGRRIFFVTTASESAATTVVGHLEREHGAEVVGYSNKLGNRQSLLADLERMESAEVLVAELKGAAIDLAARLALERGMDVVFCRNDVVTVGGDGAFDDLARAIAQQAAERFSPST